MTSIPSNDFDDLTADWQAIEVPGPASDAIQQYVWARTRLLRIWVGGEAVVGVVGLIVVGFQAWRTPDVVERLAMVSLGVVVTLALLGSWWNWAGVITLTARSTAEYVTLSIERLRRLRRAYWAGWGLLVAEVVLFALWLGHRSLTDGGSGRGFVLLTIVTGVAVWFQRWLRRWIARDARRVDEIRSQLLD